MTPRRGPQPVIRTTRLLSNGKRMAIWADTQEHADAEADLLLRAVGGQRRERVIIITSPGLTNPITITPEMMDGKEHDVGDGVTVRFEKVERVE